MFPSCRLCHRPTNLWQDFCDACALAEETPALRGVPGGRFTRGDVRRADESKRKKESKLTLVYGDRRGDAEDDG